VLNLVDPVMGLAMAFATDGEAMVHSDLPEGHVDAVVVYARTVR
jgi:hypothetical protein